MERMISEDQGGYRTLTLANGETVERGKLVAIDTANAGVIVKAKPAAGIVPIGIAMETLVGDGVKQLHIKFHREYQGTWWENDTTTPATVADRGKRCYVKDDETVSMDGTGRSPAGMVLDVSPTEGVLVVFGLPTFETETA